MTIETEGHYLDLLNSSNDSPENLQEIRANFHKQCLPDVAYWTSWLSCVTFNELHGDDVQSKLSALDSALVLCPHEDVALLYLDAIVGLADDEQVGFLL